MANINPSSNSFSMNPQFQNNVINHCRIMQLLRESTIFLQKIFKNRWKAYSQLQQNNEKEWDDSEECVSRLSELSVVPHLIERFKKENLDQWDISLAVHAIQIISKEIQNYGGKTPQQEDILINILKEIRNKFAHGKFELSDLDFAAYWKQISNILIKFGAASEQLEILKENLMKIGESSKAEPIPENDKSEFAKLRTKANNLFIENNFQEAIQVYTQMLRLSNISSENHALAFSNRSAANLMLKDEFSIKMAKVDAERAIEHWPCWWRGYYRLAMAQIKLQEWEEAKKSLEKALALNPQSKDAREQLYHVKSTLVSFHNEEHLLPYYPAMSSCRIVKDFCKKAEMTEEKFLSEISKLSGINPAIENSIKGYEYLEGDCVKIDLERAFYYFSIAAKLNFPDAMYNVGRMYYEGNGVKCDYEKAMHWLMKAATTDTSIEVDRGIAEAQHFIGAIYQEGIGVTRDYYKAAEWYEKALNNGYYLSANNLGALYNNGHGVEKSATKAVAYYKLAATQGITVAMHNLAKCYFSGCGISSPFVLTENDIETAKEWMRTAANLGDLRAAREWEGLESIDPEVFIHIFNKRLKERLNFVSTNNEPLNQELHYNTVKAASKKGSIMANEILNIWKHLDAAMDAFRKKNSDGLVIALSKAIRLDLQLISVPELFKPVIEQRFKTHPDDLHTITCYIQMSSKLEKNLALTLKCYDKFPNDEYLLLSLMTQYWSNDESLKAIEVCEKAVKLYPDSKSALFGYAVYLRFQNPPSPDCIEILNKIIAIAPKDHRRIPSVYYLQADYYLRCEDIGNFRGCYEAGLKAEKDQLLCFMPYDFPVKEFLQRFYDFETKLNNDISTFLNKGIKRVETPFSQNLKSIQANPYRKALLLRHRDAFFHGNKNSKNKLCDDLWDINDSKNTPPPNLISLNPITLKDMDFTLEKVYNGFVLEGRILDFIYIYGSIFTVIEDKNGDVERIAIKCYPVTGKLKSDIMKKFRPNVIIKIINPYKQQQFDHQNAISVETPDFMQLDDSNADKKCFCCGKEPSKLLACKKCSKVFYCSKECQKQDSIGFNHKNVCQTLKKTLQ